MKTSRGLAAFTFHTSVLVAPGQRPPVMRDVSLRLSAAFAEADELVQIADYASDTACLFHFAKGSVTRSVWRKRGAAGKDFNNDVENETDSKEVERKPGDIKVVGRIEYCNGIGPANMKDPTTRIYGCAFDDGTFMVPLHETLEDSQLRGAVIAHEYGHNVCNCDSEERSEVMCWRGADEPQWARVVTPGQCKKYLAPKGSIRCRVCPPIKRESNGLE